MRENIFRLFTWLIFISLEHPVETTSLPTVDLGYQVHQAISFNSTDGIYNFTNIRYAEPPLGELRFAAPVPPKGRSDVIQDGRKGAICPQAAPIWQGIAAQFVAAAVSGQLPFDYNAALDRLKSENTSTAMDGRTTEDCLVLDVLVTKAVFDKAHPPLRAGEGQQGAPVVVWIYGGGYVFGSKEFYGDPVRLIRASQKNNSPGIVWVAMNYRLGAFGFLAGPSLRSNGTANAGLYDQRLALEWVQQNIAKFGGDPDQVTIIGESAGGGSIFHQITAYGGRTNPPFQQAITQSGGWIPNPSNEQQEQVFEDFLALLNVTTLQEARNLPSSSLIEANLQQILAAPHGTYPYGPAVDGSFVPGLPSNLLMSGSFSQNIAILNGHTTNEGLYFMDPRIVNESDFKVYIRRYMPSMTDSVLQYVVSDLYPPLYDGSQPYGNFFERVNLFTSEVLLSCNNYYLNQAFRNRTYSYIFSVPPGIHGQDLAYTSFDGASPDVVNTTVAEVLQDYIVSFAKDGAPYTPLPETAVFPSYDREGKVLNLSASGISTISDPRANVRCLWWQKSLYY